MTSDTTYQNTINESPLPTFGKDLKTVLLLNPPGDKIFLRQYYCSQVSKANYIYHLVDFNVLAGRLTGHYNIQYLDAIVNNLEEKNVLEEISAMDIDAIIFLTGYVSFDIDIKFIEKIKKIKPIPIIANGDIMVQKGEKLLQEHRCIDAAITDFTQPDILDYLAGNYQNVSKMFYRQGDNIICPDYGKKAKEYSIPTPRHDLGAKQNYRHPFVRRYPFATVLTDFGCAYTCTFCVYATMDLKYRPTDEVITELATLKSQDIKDVYFLDQTFGAVKNRYKDLLEKMIETKLGLSWFCFSRVDVLDRESLTLMKKAGCHTIMFGVESADAELLKSYQKGYSHIKIRETFEIAQELGIQTMGTFILGLPEEDRASVLATINLAKELKCDYASFNFAVPRMGTKFREKALERKMITEDHHTMDQSGSFLTLNTGSLTKEDIVELRKYAYRSFYLRPSYLWRRVRTIGSITQLKVQFLDGLKIIKNIILKTQD